MKHHNPNSRILRVSWISRTVTTIVRIELTNESARRLRLDLQIPPRLSIPGEDRALRAAELIAYDQARCIK
jgi:hypothetical protein